MTVSTMRAVRVATPGARMLMPLSQALSSLLDGLRPVALRDVGLDEARGAVLGEPMTAPGPVPDTTVALRPGWAVASADTVGTSAYAPAAPSREPVRVAAGDNLPAGLDAVVDADAVHTIAGGWQIAEAVAPGTGARRAGEDAAAGSILREAGQRLRKIDIAVALAAGIARLRVRQPRLLLVDTAATGPALACADCLSAFAERFGARVTRSQGAALGSEEADLVVAVGDAAALLSTLPASARIVARGIALRPGEDTCMARIGEVPVVFVPAGLDAGLAVAIAILRPVLDRLAEARPDRASVVAPITRKIVSLVGFSEIALLRSMDGGSEPLAAGDLPLAAIGAADSWLMVPPGREGYALGEVVAAVPL